MDYQHSRGFEELACLRESLRNGEWTKVETLAAEIRGRPLPGTPAELDEYLHEMKEILIAAKAWRANAITSLARVRAAAGFSGAGEQTPSRRQNFAVSPVS